MLPEFVLSVYKKRIIEQITMLCNIIPMIMEYRIMIEDTFICNVMNKLYLSYYWQFLSFSFTQSVRTFCADRKNQRALRMGAFLTAAEADGFWGCGTTVQASTMQACLQIVYERSRW